MKIKPFLFFLTWLLLALFSLALLWYADLVWYGYLQAKGQLSILYKAQPIEAQIHSKECSDSLKNRLLLVLDVKKFAENELGLVATENFNTFYDQKGQPLLWNVTASEQFSLTPYEWTFPIVGRVGYKGFFEESLAHQEAAKIAKMGYDTSVYVVSAWSTLGFFQDPVLSEFLKRSEGDIAELIIHELMHATVYYADSVSFNENLATFVGERGALLYLQKRYGGTSTPYLHYQNSLGDAKIFLRFMLQAAQYLDQSYTSWQNLPQMTLQEKHSQKQRLMQQLREAHDTLPYATSLYTDYVARTKLNNTFFLDFLRYNSQQDALSRIYTQNCQQDLKRFIEYIIKDEARKP